MRKAGSVTSTSPKYEVAVVLYLSANGEFYVSRVVNMILIILHFFQCVDYG